MNSLLLAVGATKFARLGRLKASARNCSRAASEIRRIACCLKPWTYDRIYGAFLGQEIMGGGAGIVERSAARYVELLERR